MIRVTNPKEFRVAVAQRASAVRIDNEQISRRLKHLAFWQEREKTRRWLLLATIIASLLALIVAHQYGLDAAWHPHWTVGDFDGHLTHIPKK